MKTCEDYGLDKETFDNLVENIKNNKCVRVANLDTKDTMIVTNEGYRIPYNTTIDIYHDMFGDRPTFE